MANKGLVIGVATLIVIWGLVVVGKQMSKDPAPVQKDLTETASSLETPAPAATEEPAAETAPAVTETPAVAEPEKTETATTEGSLLEAPEGLNIDVNKVMEERVLGSPDAPVTIIEYASMTCPHCAYFHKEIFADIKARLIDTGKVMFIFREYPLDGTAMKASMLARCAEPDKFFNLIEVIFRNQESWIKKEDPVKALSQYAALAGMDENLIKLCVGNAELENALLGKINDGQSRYNITQTPTFIFDGGEEKFSGAQPVEKFEEVVNKLTAAKGK